MYYYKQIRHLCIHRINILHFLDILSLSIELVNLTIFAPNIHENNIHWKQSSNYYNFVVKLCSAQTCTLFKQMHRNFSHNSVWFRFRNISLWLLPQHFPRLHFRRTRADVITRYLFLIWYCCVDLAISHTYTVDALKFAAPGDISEGLFCFVPVVP